MNELKNISGIDSAVVELAGIVAKRREAIVANLAPYKKGVVTEETLAAWKKDRAKLNKERTEIKKERTTMESEWKDLLAPISDAYKAIDADYDEAMTNIDKQTKAFEQARKDAKRAHIEQMWAKYNPAPEVAGWLSLGDVYMAKWENVGTSDGEILTAINNAFTALLNGYLTIKAMGHPYEAEGLKELRETRGDVMAAIAKMNELRVEEEIIRERMAATVAENATVENAEPEFIDDFDEPSMVRVTATIPAEYMDRVSDFFAYIGCECEFTNI